MADCIVIICKTKADIGESLESHTQKFVDVVLLEVTNKVPLNFWTRT